MTKKIAAICLLGLMLYQGVAMAGAVTKDGYYNGIRLAGKVKVVTSFPDIKVKRVNAFPTDVGKWQFVTSGEDFTIQYVDAFPDIKIKFVDALHGVP